MEFGKSIKNLWLLDDKIVYLNHGSYGAAPVAVIEEAERIQRTLESEPVSFFADGYFDKIRQTAAKLAAFVGSAPENLVLIENATTAVNTVLRSLMPVLNSGDEIIITNQTYPAVKMACKYVSDISGCKIRELQLPWPITSSQELIDIYLNVVNKNTRLVILDHLFYTTGIINPVKEIAAIVKHQGADVLVDGAHVPGMFPLDIESLGVDWYTGNCHKWLFAAKGAAFLWTSPGKQKITKPLSISYYYGESYTKEFDWTGTRNPVPFLALNAAIDFHTKTGSEKIFNYIHNLAVEARHLIAAEINSTLNVPDEMFGAMVSFELPDVKREEGDFVNDLRRRFFMRYGIEVPFTEFDGRIFIRYSAQIYNELDDYKILLKAMRDYFNK